MLSNAEDEFSSLVLLAWDDDFYLGVTTDALASQLWKFIIVVDDVDLANYGTIDVKRAHHLA